LNRLLLTLPIAAIGLGALLSSACGFSSPPYTACTVVDGSATVSSPTGSYGPPDFNHVNRDYALSTNCGEGQHDHRTANLVADAHFTPANRGATEHIVGEVQDQPFDLATSWTCSDDPWLVKDVSCSQVSFDQRQGKLPDGFVMNPTEPLTAMLIDDNGRSDIASRLLVDFFNKLKSNPSGCTNEFASVVAAPTANQHFLGTPIDLNVQRAAGCSPAADGVQPVFQLEWQHLDPISRQFSDVPIVPSFDGTANPSGTTVPQALFKQADGMDTFNVWQVRAKLVNTPQDAPWSDFVTFIVVPGAA
jgi:hypothetical protein